jgi:lipoprotein-anchoring transpeptidase ErfK/SrfK
LAADEPDDGFIASLVAEEPDEPDAEAKPRSKALIALIALLLLLLISGGCIGGVWLTHRGKAAPGATLGGQEVGGMTRDEMVSYLEDLSEGLSFEITVGNITKQVMGKAIGVGIDTETTVRTAFETWDAASFPAWLNPWHELAAPIIGIYDIVKLQAYLDVAFGGVPATSPSVVFDADTAAWVMTPGQQGQGVSAQSLLPGLKAAVESSGLRGLSATAGVIAPLVTDVSAQAVTDRLNQINADPPVIMYADAPRYTLTPADVAAWVVLGINAADSAFELTFDTQAIVTAIEGPLAPILLIKGQDEFQVDLPNGESVMVVPGVDGLRPDDTARFAESIAVALAADPYQGATIEPEWVSAPSTIKHIMAGPYHEGRWVDINLTAQTLVVFDGQQPLNGYRISSGVEKTPTTPGNYRVFDKAESATISGPGWHYTGVTWVAWNRLYGIVGAPWRGDFGFPQSSGLIEVAPEAAQQLYLMLSVGDPIEIHG